MDWINLSQNRIWWQDLENMTIKLSVPYNIPE